ncbi:hypothetical protein PR048_029151 [Dryococelus australis]|uniref:Uncharacterized protein n=1 Tax=Dryococelus australis TaxID=614101 RepID=A0ABQ9GCJ9_9NEOP|nr:hypothetical protein PR048_029151 [Dryococelus australis]
MPGHKVVAPPPEVLELPRRGAISWHALGQVTRDLCESVLQQIKHKVAARRILLQPCFRDYDTGRGGVLVSLIAFHQGDLGSIPGGDHSFSHVGIEHDACIYRSPSLAFWYCSILTSLRCHRLSIPLCSESPASLYSISLHSLYHNLLPVQGSTEGVVASRIGPIKFSLHDNLSDIENGYPELSLRMISGRLHPGDGLETKQNIILIRGRGCCIASAPVLASSLHGLGYLSVSRETTTMMTTTNSDDNNNDDGDDGGRDDDGDGDDDDKLTAYCCSASLNNGHVSRAQFRQCLAAHGLLCSPEELYALEQRYCSDVGFNYAWFLLELESARIDPPLCRCRVSATSGTCVHSTLHIRKANVTGAPCKERLQIGHHKLESAQICNAKSTATIRWSSELLGVCQATSSLHSKFAMGTVKLFSRVGEDRAARSFNAVYNESLRRKEKLNCREPRHKEQDKEKNIVEILAKIKAQVRIKCIDDI